MSDADRKARQLISQARVKLSSRKSFFSWLFQTKWSKIEEAIELFQKACNLLRIAKKWGEVGDVLCEIAVLHEEIGTKHDVACDYVSAASCFKKIDRIKAIECLGKAAEVYTDIGRFVLAAKQLQGIAELYEVEELDLRKAIDHYEQAADYFKGEENNLSADKCLLKVAKYEAQFENYEKSIRIYEDIAINTLKNDLMKYTAKDNFFRALLCHLCVDVLNAKYAVDKYKDIYPGLQDSRECKMIVDLIEQIEEKNVERFTEVVGDYDSISRLDSWFTMILLRIKKFLYEDIDLK